MSAAADSLNERLVIIGTGCAGTELAFSVRSAGWTGPITLMGEEPANPYQRPPLSKAFLTGEATAESLQLRTPELYKSSNIDLRTDVRAVSIDRVAKTVSLVDGTAMPYDRLVLATGGRPRPLPAADAGAAAANNFFYLRTLADSAGIRARLTPGESVVIIGGGYVGLEVAAAAVKGGMRVTVLEAAPRVLARVTAPVVSSFYEEVHREAGVEILTGEQVDTLTLSPNGQRITEVSCASGRRLQADLVVAGIGLLPNSELASECGLAVDDGIVVDAALRTTDPEIFAIGDCTRYFSAVYGRPVRIESVPSALEQARKAAVILCGKAPRPDAVPWFWSDQYHLNLKMVGLSSGYDRLVLRGSLEQRSFSAFYLAGNRVLAVDTVNRPVEFNLSKRLIAERIAVDPTLLGDDSVPLKQLMEVRQDQPG
jgi:3-phenylpropionate/trans-cinnamate dioxygenase ferredoxin reductase subunit